MFTQVMEKWGTIIPNGSSVTASWPKDLTYCIVSYSQCRRVEISPPKKTNVKSTEEIEDLNKRKEEGKTQALTGKPGGL